jgi:hypothetical protein
MSCFIYRSDKYLVLFRGRTYVMVGKMLRIGQMLGWTNFGLDKCWVGKILGWTNVGRTYVGWTNVGRTYVEVGKMLGPKNVGA